jgi:hypothetical protein
MFATFDPERKRLFLFPLIFDDEIDIDKIHRPDGRRSQEELVAPRVEFFRELPEANGVVHGLGLLIRSVVFVPEMIIGEDLVEAESLGSEKRSALDVSFF